MYICVGVAFIVYIGLMAGQAVWIYFYVKTSLHPDPDRFITSTFTRWKFYIIFMYLFGGAYTILNLSLWGSLAMSVLCKCDFRARCGSILNPLFCVFFPLFAGCMIAFPAFGPLIHLCNAAHLSTNVTPGGAGTARRAQLQGPGYIANTAVFTTSRDNSPMFSFDLTNQTDPLFASFHIRQFNAPESALSSSLVPAVRSITYDFVRQSFNGTCATSRGAILPVSTARLTWPPCGKSQLHAPGSVTS
ncbi:hypothetical protein BKA62DRAFT_128325 [Auriculariales sp. MPI-PUGE-AT-0066]|nr:hypothetical protein BKA62DRAFT_128325 [Auriculariales sp. MPI-PUGE-AT-0066]